MEVTLEREASGVRQRTKLERPKSTERRTRKRAIRLPMSVRQWVCRDDSSACVMAMAGEFEGLAWKGATMHGFASCFRRLRCVDNSETKVDLSLLLTPKCKSYVPSLHIASEPLYGSAVSGGGWIVVRVVTKDTLAEVSNHEREAITEGDLWFPAKQLFGSCDVRFALVGIVCCVWSEFYFGIGVNSILHHLCKLQHDEDFSEANKRWITKEIDGKGHTDGINIAPVGLYLWVLQGITINLTGACEEKSGSYSLGQAQHVESSHNIGLVNSRNKG
ncbi:hypothetical protein BHM03_00023549 [Ensete ventricosum]|nr:hypothetical protein BHM03_00023549 [Ensete ventricosum]